jgi:RecA/RadA recombinase
MAAKLNYSTVYIDTEKKISVHRLKEMASYRYNDSMSRISENGMASLLGTGNVPFSYGCQTHRGTLSLSAISQQEFLQSAVATPTSPMNPSQGIGNNGNGNMFKNADDVVKNMIFRRPHSTNDLLQTLMSLESEIVHWNDDIVMDQNQTSHNQPPNKSSSSPTTTTTARKQFPVRLIVVDSIAATMRRDFGADAFPQRASAIFQCAQILKRLADQLNLAIFVINQVGAGNNSISDIQGGWNSGTGSSSSIINADPRAVKAALGTSWHHCVSTRLFMEEITNQQVQQQQQQTTDDDDYHHADGEDHGDRSHVGMMGKYSQRRSRRRKVVIVKSNLVPLAETYYEISTAGIVDV